MIPSTFCFDMVFVKEVTNILKRIKTSIRNRTLIDDELPL